MTVLLLHFVSLENMLFLSIYWTSGYYEYFPTAYDDIGV